MKNINSIRSSLAQIDALIRADPIKKRSGNEDGVVVPINKPIKANKPIFDDNFDEVIVTDQGDFPIYETSSWDDGNNDLSEELDEIDPIIEYGPKDEDQLPVLGNDKLKEISQNIEESGTDALGYYRSFHIIGKQWGVFITSSGILHMAHQFASLGLKSDIAIKNAFQLILSHELFHFTVDYTISQLEIILGQPIWIPQSRSLLSKNPNYLLIEEKMANAYMMKRARTGRSHLKIDGKMKLLKEFIQHQPQGYKDALEIKRANFNDGLIQLGINLISEARNGGASLRFDGIQSSCFDWPNMFQYEPQVDWKYCPIFLLDNTNSILGKLPNDYVQAFSVINEIKEPVKFLKMLSNLPNKIQAKWLKTKHSLAIAIRKSHDFKKWRKSGPGVFSIKVDRAIRAHIKYDRTNNEWIALEIGRHKEMGHG